MDAIQRLSYGESVGAINFMALQASILRQTIGFGIGADTDVTLDGDPMTWE